MKQIDDISVGDAMTRGVICVGAKDTAKYAAEVMDKNDISSVIVADKTGGVGMITERDILTKVVLKSKDANNVKCSQIMTSPLITIGPNATIDEAAIMMRDKNIRRIVVSEKGKIIGVISEFDIVKIEPTLHMLIRESSQWSIDAASATERGTIAGECETCENYSENLRSMDGRLICEDCREK
ncbi:MAG: CBS domain-containing protein [Candidatus Altiarchaeota archaeon]|nr:CBS domain-containing protein [Candidatus Altiarchaeota archaeon]